MQSQFPANKPHTQRRQTFLEFIGSAPGDAGFVALFHDALTEWPSTAVPRLPSEPGKYPVTFSQGLGFGSALTGLTNEGGNP